MANDEWKVEALEDDMVEGEDETEAAGRDLGQLCRPDIRLTLQHSTFSIRAKDDGPTRIRTWDGPVMSRRL